MVDAILFCIFDTLETPLHGFNFTILQNNFLIAKAK